jgi:5-methylcytosine-specific restriction endonuclease McrA
VGGPPRIVGLPEDLELISPDALVGRIRFHASRDILDQVERAIRRCRSLLEENDEAPTGADTSEATIRRTCFTAMLVHFLQSQDTPEARRILARHAVIARDNCHCRIQGCTKRGELHGHHLWLRSRQGPDDLWNRVAACAGHHNQGLHAGVVEMCGHAPDLLFTKLGVEPATGRAFATYLNERRVDPDIVDTALEVWRAYWRRRRKGEVRDPEGERLRALMARVASLAVAAEGEETVEDEESTAGSAR